MKELDAAAVSMVSGGTSMADWVWGNTGGAGGGGGGGGGAAGGAGGGGGRSDAGAWESGWGAWDTPSPPSEGHLAFDTALAGAAGARTGMAVEAFTGAALVAAGVASTIALPIAAIGGLVAGGYAYFGAKKALEH